MKRTLSLKREQLTALTTDELAAFRGAGEGEPQPTPPQYAPTAPLDRCLPTVFPIASCVVCTGTTCQNC